MGHNTLCTIKGEPQPWVSDGLSQVQHNEITGC